MCFMTIEDETGSISVTVFPKLFQQIENMDLDGKIFVFVGRGNVGQRGDLELIADRLNDPKQFTVQLPAEKLYLRVTKQLDTAQNLEKLYEIIEESKGKMPVIIYREKNRQALLLKSNHWIDFNSNVRNKLEMFLGKRSVLVKKSN